jgi:hypothetical protein
VHRIGTDRYSIGQYDLKERLLGFGYRTVHKEVISPHIYPQHVRWRTRPLSSLSTSGRGDKAASNPLAGDGSHQLRQNEVEGNPPSGDLFNNRNQPFQPWPLSRRQVPSHYGKHMA